MKINNQILDVEIVNVNDDIVTILVDERVYDVDIRMVEKGVYSILHDNRSYNVELIQGNESRSYTVNTQYKTYDLEIIDAQTKYKESRNKNEGFAGAGAISSPMPGRVIKLLVKKGDKVKAGQTLIVISAMKMESEFKSGIDGTVKDILIKEGQTVEGNQIMVEIE